MTHASPALSDADIDRLQSLLMSRAVPGGGMNLEMLDGLMSALIVGPADVPAEEYLPLVFGPSPSWDGDGERAEAEALVGRLRTHIERRIDIDPDHDEGAFMPFVAMPADLPDDPDAFERASDDIDYPLGAAWAGGFLYAVDLRLPQWQRWEREVEGLEESIGFLLRLIQLEPGEEGAAPPTFRERINMMAAMPYMLRILHYRRRLERARPQSSN